jgi:hypothetical protein
MFRNQSGCGCCTPTGCSTVTVKVHGCNLSGPTYVGDFPNVTVKLKNGSGTVLDTRVTDSTGMVTFSVPSAATYSFEAIPPGPGDFRGDRYAASTTLSGQFLTCGTNSTKNIVIPAKTGYFCCAQSPIGLNFAGQPLFGLITPIKNVLTFTTPQGTYTIPSVSNAVILLTPLSVTSTATYPIPGGSPAHCYTPSSSTVQVNYIFGCAQVRQIFGVSVCCPDTDSVFYVLNRATTGGGLSVDESDVTMYLGDVAFGPVSVSFPSSMTSANCAATVTIPFPGTHTFSE